MKTRTATALFIGLLLLAGVCNALQRSQEPLFETVLFPIYMLMFLHKKELPKEILFTSDFSDLNGMV